MLPEKLEGQLNTRQDVQTLKLLRRLIEKTRESKNALIRRLIWDEAKRQEVE
jgi:hypothetical protein